MEEFVYYSDGEQSEMLYGTTTNYNYERDYSDYSELSEGVEEGIWLETCPHPYDGGSSPRFPEQGNCACADQSDSDDCSSCSASSAWETDNGLDSVTSGDSGIYPSTGSTVSTNVSCRISASTSTTSWETASSEESSSSWETASSCSCETAPCQCYLQSSSPRWDRTPSEYPIDSPANIWMSHPIAEGGGRSGSLVPLLPSASHLRAPRRRTYYLRRLEKMNSSGVGRRQEFTKNLKVSEHKSAHRHPAHRPCVPTANSAPINPIAAQRKNPAQKRSRRRRFRWHTLQTKKRKTTATDAVKIGDGVVGPSGINQRQLRAASCPKAVHYQRQ